MSPPHSHTTPTPHTHTPSPQQRDFVANGGAELAKIDAASPAARRSCATLCDAVGSSDAALVCSALCGRVGAVPLLAQLASRTPLSDMCQLHRMCPTEQESAAHALRTRMRAQLPAALVEVGGDDDAATAAAEEEGEDETAAADDRSSRSSSSSSSSAARFASLTAVPRAASASGAPPLPSPRQPAEARLANLRDVRLNVGLVLNGTLETDAISTYNLTVLGDVTANAVTASHVHASVVTTDIVEVGIIRSPTGTITIDGNLALDGSLGSGSGGGGGGGSRRGGMHGGRRLLAHLDLDFSSPREVLVDSVRQWRLVAHDDFDDLDGESKGEGEGGARAWHVVRGNDGSGSGSGADALGSCGSSDRFLGGPCVLGGRATATRAVRGLPPHTETRLTARFHFIDRWRGEAALARLDDRVVWMEGCGRPAAATAACEEAASAAEASAATTLNVCGSSHPEMRLGASIDVTTPHSDDALNVTFGALLPSGLDACIASWGVDDIALYVR